MLGSMRQLSLKLISKPMQRLHNSKIRCMQLIAEILVLSLKTSSLVVNASMASIANQLIARRRNVLVNLNSITVFHMPIVIPVSIVRQVRIGLLPPFASNKEMNTKSASLMKNVKIINFAGTQINHSKKLIQGLA